MSAGRTRSTPGDRAPLLPRSPSPTRREEVLWMNEVVQIIETGDQDRWSPTGAAWPASVVPRCPAQNGSGHGSPVIHQRLRPLAVRRVREPARPLRQVHGLLSRLGLLLVLRPSPRSVAADNAASPLRPAIDGRAQTGNPGVVPTVHSEPIGGLEVASYAHCGYRTRLRRRSSPWPSAERP